MFGSCGKGFVCVLLLMYFFIVQETMLSIDKGYTLSNGYKIPLLGLGCWDMTPDEAYKAVLTALETGYRLIDTAAFYKNEEAVGRALKECGLMREEYFVVTKLQSSMHGYEETKRDFQESYEKLQLDYVDLYLIHTPRVGRNVESWKAMVELRDEGKIRSIGVSNFSAEHLEEFHKCVAERPVVNQIEIHPANRQEETVTYCKKNNILLMNYCPLARTQLFPPNRLPLFDEMETKLKKTKAQLFLKWALQSGFVTIPKSVNAARIKENTELFGWSICDADMTAVGNLEDDVQISVASYIMHEPWSALEK